MWTVNEDYTKAEFVAASSKMEVYYKANGDVLARSKGISLYELPVAAKRRFAKKFEGYNVTEAIKFEGFDEVAYYISGENDKESVILKVNDQDMVSVFKKTKK